MLRKPLLTGKALQERARTLGVDTAGTGGGANVPGSGFIPFSAPDHELQRRVLEAERHQREHRLWVIAFISAIASTASALAAWMAVVVTHLPSGEFYRTPTAVIRAGTIDQPSHSSRAMLAGSADTRRSAPQVAHNLIASDDKDSGTADAKPNPTGPGTAVSHTPRASVDYIYWAFSSAAQSVSAFVALLLAGYAIVNTFMEAARTKDESLEEIHAVLRVRYHRQLAVLAGVTSGAVLFSLYIVYINRPSAPAPLWSICLGATLDIAAIAGGLIFVIAVIDPRKHMKTAKQVLKQESAQIADSGRRAASSDFFDAFLHLERVVRDYLRTRDLYVPSRGSPQMSFSFRQMIEALLRNEKIDRNFYNSLLELNKYRNLVFHGHVDDVEQIMVDRVRSAADRVQHLP